MLPIAAFEIRTKLKRLSTYVYFFVFGSDKVFINAPFALAQTIAVLGLLGVVTIAAMMGRAVQQDFEYQTFHFFYTSPIRKRDYLLGRYFGAVVTLLLIFCGIVVGILVGSHWPGVDRTRVGPWSADAFLRPYLLLLLPNILWLGAIFFGLAALTRRMLPVYIAGVVALIGWLAAGRLLRDIDNRMLAALIDPLGTTAVGLVTRYWSLAEKNTLALPLADELLWNRALWLAVGAIVFAFCYARFRLAYESGSRRTKVEPSEGTGRATRAAQPLSSVTTDTRPAAYLVQLPAVIALNLRETVKNVYFIVIVAAGALFILSNAKVLGSFFGTNTYPVTYQVLDFASGSFGIFMLVITTLYAGELVWRERDHRMALISDSMPAPTWLPFTGKLVALMATQALLQVVVMVCAILVQLVNGYTKLELGQYVHRLFLIQLPEYWMLAALAFTVHAVVDNKYLGQFVFVLFYVAMVALEGFGYRDHLYLFGETIGVTYSDMNGYGHFLGPKRWFDAYWGAVSVLLVALARLYWVRGTDTGWKVRSRIAATRFSAPLIASGAVAAMVFAGTGAWIFYNTHVLNPYRSEFESDELKARYERDYKALLHRPQPKIVAARVMADLFPHEHRITFKGTFTLRNKSGEAVPELYLNVPESAAVKTLAGSIPMKLVEERRELDWKRFALEHPLQPGETMTLDFELSYPPPGFTNSGASRLVVDNGTFVNSHLLPRIGYQEGAELTEDRKRTKHGLPHRERMHDIDDGAARMHNYISNEADWMDFEATIGTAADQVAIAPGYLQKEWTEGGRRYFQYRMDAPILDFYAFLSAHYAVKKDTWRAPDGRDVALEIHYHPGHEYNLDAMMAGMKDSLDYYTRHFSPYQHHQMRIVEFPRYAQFAQSFPNTVPFSESIGFIAKVDPKDPKDIDYPYYVTAHEVAHQWWAHQVIGADVQGATMLSETLAQYSALMVMKRRFGDAKMKRFLKYELDNYLGSRGREREKEMPLYRNENQQYIHYRKGSLAMYALQDAIGEDAVNRALASYIRKFAFQEPPYTTTRDLLAEFRAVTPPESQELIKDLFETITLWENRAISATYREKGSGRYEVTMKVSARKIRADEQGRQTDVPMDDLVDIGVLGENDVPLYLRKHRIRTGESTLTVEVEGKPLKAGIDPVVKLIDRRPDDNVVAVTLSGS